MHPARMVSIFGFLAGLMAVCMAALSFSTGVTQEYFEHSHPVNEYVAKLISQSDVLKIILTLDNFFLLFYGGFFLWYIVERRGKADSWLLAALGLCMFLTMLLDVVENFHIMGMQKGVETGVMPSDEQIGLQYILSAVKFMLAYFAVIILGVTFPRDTALARFVGTSTAIVFPILGVLGFTVPAPWSLVCGIGRSIVFVFGFILSGVVYWNRSNLSTGVPT